MPTYRDWFVNTAVPWVEQRTHLQLATWLDPEYLIEQVRAHWDRAGGIATTALGYLSRSGFALFAWVANIVLIPVLTFFFLRDWDVFVERVAALVPRDHLDVASRLAQESSDMLGGFLRGQFTVMLILGAMYGIGLWAIGLDLGLLIGIVAGLLTFVPYLGPTSGVVFGVIAALVQYGDWKHVAAVLAVFGVGQVIESYWLTPKLVGDRIGLHPVAVIFAVLAGGQLFGFLGMLLALPVAAVANVLLRYAHVRYTHSRLYAGDAPAIVVADAHVSDGAIIVPGDRPGQRRGVSADRPRPARAQLPLALRYPPDQRFEGFVAAHEGALAQLHALATGAGSDWLYLVGAPGVGKTHLALAACAAAEVERAPQRLSPARRPPRAACARRSTRCTTTISSHWTVSMPSPANPTTRSRCSISTTAPAMPARPCSTPRASRPMPCRWHCPTCVRDCRNARAWPWRRSTTMAVARCCS